MMYLFAQIKELLNAEFVFAVATFPLYEVYKEPVPNVTAHPYIRVCCRMVTYVFAVNMNMI